MLDMSRKPNKFTLSFQLGNLAFFPVGSINKMCVKSFHEYDGTFEQEVVPVAPNDQMEYEHGKGCENEQTGDHEIRGGCSHESDEMSEKKCLMNKWSM